jgi:hypothetical protein
VSSRPPLDLDELFAPLRAVRIDTDRSEDVLHRLREPAFFPRPGLATLLPSLGIPLAALLLALVRLAVPVAEAPGAWGSALRAGFSVARGTSGALLEAAFRATGGLLTGFTKLLQGLPLPSGGSAFEAATWGSLLTLGLFALMTLLLTTRELRSGVPERIPSR